MRVSMEQLETLIEKDFPELREIVGKDKKLLATSEEAQPNISIVVQRIDWNFLRRVLTDIENVRDDIEVHHHLYAWTCGWFWSIWHPIGKRYQALLTVRLRNAEERYWDSDQTEPYVSSGKPLYWSLQRMGGMRNIKRLCLIKIEEQKQGGKLKVEIEVWKPKKDINLKRAVKELMKDEYQKLQNLIESAS